MIEILPELTQYLDKHLETESELLQKIRRETYIEVLQPHMISGAYQGRLLSLISKIKSPKTILELGTFTGYSALCLAEGLQNDGHLYTIELNDELQKKVNKYFQESIYKDQIHLLIGSADEILQTELKNQTFDLIFLDADKKNYSLYFDLLVPQLSSGGIILADNVLWYGKVLQTTEEMDSKTKIIDEFNNKVLTDNRVESVILPIRDGITLIRKK